MAHHGFESYWVEGEGVLSVSGDGREVRRSRRRRMVRRRRSGSARMGPKGTGKQLGEPNHRKLARAMTAGRGGFGNDPGRLHVPRPVRRPRPDVRQDDRRARREHPACAAAAGALAEPRPRLALRRRAGRPGVGEVLQRRRAPEDGQDRRRRAAAVPGARRVRPAARGRQRLEGEEAQGQHPRPAQRREPRRRPDAPGDDPLPQPGRRQPAERRCPPRRSSRRRATSSPATTSGC